MVGDRDELLAIQRAYRIDRSFVFCLDEPDRHPAFTRRERPDARARRRRAGRADAVRPPRPRRERRSRRRSRCIDLGARGIKLHPRAQRFLPDDPRLEPVFALAAERRVPILIHGGRGLPPIADSLARLLDRHAPPALIVAHAGIVDLAAMARELRRTRRASSSTPPSGARSTCSTSTGSSRRSRSSTRRDYPYGRQPNSLLMAVRTARASGLDDAQVRAMLHDTAARIADGLDPVPPSAPQRARRSSRIPSPSSASTST